MRRKDRGSTADSELSRNRRSRDVPNEADRRRDRKRSRSRDDREDERGGGAGASGLGSKRRNRRLARDSSSEDSDEEIKDEDDADEEEDLDEEALIERRRRQRQELVARLEGGKTGGKGKDRDNHSSKITSLKDQVSDEKVEPPEAALSVSASSPGTSTQDGTRSHERARSTSPQPVILDSDGDTTFSKVS